MHLLSHCGPLPEAVLLQSLHITQLPPFLRDTPAEPVPRTMQRFLQERPALFAPCDATPGHDSAWAAVPGRLGRQYLPRSVWLAPASPWVRCT